MGKRLGLALLGLAIAWAWARGATPRNILVNGGFEQGLVGWQADPKHSLLDDPKMARSGRKCLTGEVTRPKQALRLIQKVRVTSGNLYRFVAWARATNNTKLVLWAMLPGARQRRLIAAWERVGRRWRRYSVPITIERDGVLELQVIAPSSFGAPPGRIWLDDLALLETAIPPVISLSEGKGFNDQPALAAAGGSLFAAWLSFRDGADTLQVARLVPDGKRLAKKATWQVVGGKGVYILGVRAIPAGGRVLVLYAAEIEKNWDIYAVWCDERGPSAPIRLTTHEAVDVKPAAAWRDGVLWVAWESNRTGTRQVFAMRVEGRRGRPERVSVAEASNYDPSVAVLDNGAVCVAWHSFRQNNYDIYLRRRKPGASWGDEQRLTKAPSIDRHALLVPRGDELWLIYENCQTSGYRIGATNRRRLVVAKVAARGLMAPKDYSHSPLYTARCEGPTAAFDRSGRLWIAFLKPRLPRAGWDAFITCYGGSQWLPPARLSARKGMDRAPQLVLLGSTAYLALQNDDIPRSWSEVDRTLEAKSDIYLATYPLGPQPAPAPMALEPLVEPPEPFEAGTLRVERGEDSPTPTITYKGQTLKLFYGDLHEHTDISVCNRVGDQSVDESYQHMRDIVRLDFACATDHGYNINPYLWCYLGKLARANNDPGRYLTFLGEEWTSSFERYDERHPYGYYGHRNLILADPYFPRWWNARNGQTPAQVWEQLRKLNANFVHIPHQLADTGNVPTDWSFHDETLQPVAEIFQVRGSYEYKGAPREAKRSTPKPGYFLQDAWARGIVIGVIASPDHGGGMGKACVYAPELSREAILDALRARHCFGTTAARIFLDVRVNGHLMGEKVREPALKSVEVQIRVRCPAPIDRIEVCRNNRFIYSRKPNAKTATLTFVDTDPLPGRSYYYVRVIQTDGEIAWSSPVWFGAQ